MVCTVSSTGATGLAKSPLRNARLSFSNYGARVDVHAWGEQVTTTGYGDVVLKQPFRMLAPIEAATGILMCGLSAGLFFATVIV